MSSSQSPSLSQAQPQSQMLSLDYESKHQGYSLQDTMDFPSYMDPAAFDAYLQYPPASPNFGAGLGLAPTSQSPMFAPLNLSGSMGAYGYGVPSPDHQYTSPDAANIPPTLSYDLSVAELLSEGPSSGRTSRISGRGSPAAALSPPAVPYSPAPAYSPAAAYSAAPAYTAATTAAPPPPTRGARAGASTSVPRSARFNPISSPAAVSRPIAKQKRRAAATKGKATKGAAAAGTSDENEEEEEEAAPPALTSAEARREMIRRQRIESEQRRRDELRDGYDHLKENLPAVTPKTSKVNVLERAVSHIRYLDQIRLNLEQRLHLAEKEVHRLRNVNEALMLGAASQRAQASNSRSGSF